MELLFNGTSFDVHKWNSNNHSKETQTDSFQDIQTNAGSAQTFLGDLFPDIKNLKQIILNAKVWLSSSNAIAIIQHSLLRELLNPLEDLLSHVTEIQSHLMEMTEDIKAMLYADDADTESTVSNPSEVPVIVDVIGGLSVSTALEIAEDIKPQLDIDIVEIDSVILDPLQELANLEDTGLRPLTAKLSKPPVLTNAEKCKAYRERLKLDKERCEVAKSKKKEANHKYWNSLTPDRKEHERERAKLRQRKRREKLKEKALVEKTTAQEKSRRVVTSKFTTRKQAQKETQKREKNRLSQQKRRANMSKQKIRWEREKRRERYLQIKERKRQQQEQRLAEQPNEDVRSSKKSIFQLLKGICF